LEIFDMGAWKWAQQRHAEIAALPAAVFSANNCEPVIANLSPRLFFS
jgi:hypothetical protein